MSGPDNSSKPSSPARREPPLANPSPLTADSPCTTHLREILWFTATVAAISLALSALVKLLITSGALPIGAELSWWKIFRRCVSVSAAMSLWIFMRRLHAKPIRSLGLGPWRQGAPWLLRGVLLGIGVIVVVGSLYLAMDACRIAIHADTLRLWRTLVLSLPAMGLVAVLEELIFRGYLLQQLVSCSKAVAIGGSSAAYAMVHLRPNLVWPGSALELIGLFILGVVLAVSVVRTQSLYLAIGLHASLAYGARVNKLLVQFSDTALPWLVGTNRLVNGVIAWAALIGIGVMVARLGKAPHSA